MPTLTKRDTHCIWFSHLPIFMSTILARLSPDEEITLIINGKETCWLRMRDGSDGRETKGIRIGPGMSKEIWEEIPLRSSFEVTFCDNRSPDDPDGSRNEKERYVVAIKNAKAVGVATPISPRILHRKSAETLFDDYEFADYSGAYDSVQQRRAIKVARAEGSNEPRILYTSFTRESLLLEFLERLRWATKNGRRLILGQDHQYSVPYALAQQIGLHLDWRMGLRMLVNGTYAPDAPTLDHPKTFAKLLNEWFVSHGMVPYFYSATKAVRYGIPDRDPRSKGDATLYRLCERYPSIFGTGSPKPFNRVGDNGSVGGQTVVGLLKILELIDICDIEGIPLKCWPFDGIDITSSEYENCHILIEPYPSAAGVRNQLRTDTEDAIAVTRMIWEADRKGTLARLLDLSPLSDPEKEVVRFEGWIAGHLPLFVMK
jgi:hypothetical protein